MTKLILLIGLPGSGKSTLAKQLLAECPQMSLISTDAIRGQLFGSQAVQGAWLPIWREIERQFQQAI
ncbi:AAA family ATPase, partial [Nostoc sp.]